MLRFKLPKFIVGVVPLFQLSRKKCAQMRLFLVLLLTTTVWGFPNRGVRNDSPGDMAQDLPNLAQQLQGKKETKRGETQRDCKGKCATSIAQKAAAEAKAAQAAQNAAGAQAAHMVRSYN